MYYPNHCMKHCCTFEQGISHPQRLCNMSHILLLFIRVIDEGVLLGNTF